MQETGNDSKQGQSKPSTPKSSGRGRGRPPGSKNKPKLPPISEEPLFDEQLLSARSSHRFDKTKPTRDPIREGEARAAKKRASKAKEARDKRVAPKRAVIREQLKEHAEQLEAERMIREAGQPPEDIASGSKA